MQCNRNKRGMTLNPTKDQGKEVVTQAGRDSRCGDRQPAAATLRSGLDYETLCGMKSDIILTVTAFGQGGPWSDKVGFDGLAQSMSGNCICLVKRNARALPIC